MIKIAMVVATMLVIANAASAQSGKTYREALIECGAKWRASDERKAAAKGQGMIAWQAFRGKCVSESGYAPKRRNVIGAPSERGA